MEPFCGYLPNSHKTDRGNTEKQTKILLRASVYGWRNQNDVSMPSPHKSVNTNNKKGTVIFRSSLTFLSLSYIMFP